MEADSQIYLRVPSSTLQNASVSLQFAGFLNVETTDQLLDAVGIADLRPAVTVSKYIIRSGGVLLRVSIFEFTTAVLQNLLVVIDHRLPRLNRRVHDASGK